MRANDESASRAFTHHREQTLREIDGAYIITARGRTTRTQGKCEASGKVGIDVVLAQQVEGGQIARANGAMIANVANALPAYEDIGGIEAAHIQRKNLPIDMERRDERLEK